MAQDILVQRVPCESVHVFRQSWSPTRHEAIVLRHLPYQDRYRHHSPAVFGIWLRNRFRCHVLLSPM